MRNLFVSSIPRLKTGHYAHIFSLQRTDSLAVFRTESDGLNLTRVAAGHVNPQAISRITILKRKQSGPERLVGRELLRQMGYISDEADQPNICRYNDLDRVCGRCADCILYGFATGDRGSEKAKVMGDSMFSISSYPCSHMNIQHTAISETGNMMKAPEDRTPNSLYRGTMFSTDYASPGVVFPSVQTVCNSTYEAFLYVLRNILSTKRYGAITTGAGVMEKRVVAIAITNAEIFSNLHMTRALYDKVGEGHDTPFTTMSAALAAVITESLANEPCQISLLLTGAELDAFLTEAIATFRDLEKLKPLMNALHQQMQDYANTYGVLARGKKET